MARAVALQRRTLGTQLDLLRAVAPLVAGSPIPSETHVLGLLADGLPVLRANIGPLPVDVLAPASVPTASLPTASLPIAPSAVPLGAPRGLKEIERDAMIDALERCHGNQTRAAELLGMPRRTFCKRLKEFEIPRPRA